MIRLLALLALGAAAVYLLRRGPARGRLADYDRRIRDLRRHVGLGEGRQSVNMSVTDFADREIAVLEKKKALERRWPYLRRDVEGYLRGLGVESARRAEELRAAAEAHEAEHPHEGDLAETVETLTQDYFDLVGLYDVVDWRAPEGLDAAAQEILDAHFRGDGSIVRVQKPRSTIWLEVYRLPGDRYLRFFRETHP
ncbi:MAG: hypothetical protein KC466_14680 [Myxococcales bacterium]|nr:hypothetical protein [Myxococcales bacterium]